MVAIRTLYPFQAISSISKYYFSCNKTFPICQLISMLPFFSGSKSENSPTQKSQIMFALENILYVLISQAQQMIMDNNISPVDTYHLRRELGMELVSKGRGTSS